jgi:hypothetical protein
MPAPPRAQRADEGLAQLMQQAKHERKDRGFVADANAFGVSYASPISGSQVYAANALVGR